MTEPLGMYVLFPETLKLSFVALLVFLAANKFYISLLED